MSRHDAHHDPDQQWTRTNARVLGQILAAQNFLFVLSDVRKIAEFYAQALSGVPGVDRCYVCLGDAHAPEDTGGQMCSACGLPRREGGGPGLQAPEFRCAWADAEGLRSLVLATPEHTFGLFLFRMNESELFDVYRPFLGNLANFVALTLENRMQRQFLEKAKEELEVKVEERTRELLVMNDALATSRREAVATMQDAIEARQRAEQANRELFHEVTERNRAEKEVRTLNLELESRVAARTIELKEANSELEAFAYSVSHDLRAPLRHIEGFLELLEERISSTLDDQSRHYMVTITDSAKRLSALIDDLLAFSRMGREALATREVDMNALVAGIIRELEPDIRGRRVEWKTGDLPIVRGDRAMLRVVMMNLIANAVKFTRPRDPARIEIGAAVVEGEFRFFVRDNGVGFDQKFAGNLFGVFQRLHSTSEFEGTGIGLANVRRIISRHGGRVSAEGEVNRGATLHFSLPIGNKGVQE